MVAAFDTNIIADVFRNKGESPKKILDYTDIYLPLVVTGELLFGAYISANPAKTLQQVQDFISTSKVLFPQSDVAENYAQIRKHLKEKGTPIPENDIWIAATAHAFGLKLVTKDKHFAQIEFLDVEFWS